MSRRAAPADPGRAVLLRALGEGYGRRAWHGPTLLDALAGVRAPEALHRAGGAHNRIWDLVLHAAHVKHLVLRRLDRTRSPSFPRRLVRPYWPELPPEPDERAWRADLALLQDFHARLVTAVRELPDEVLARRRPGKSRTLGEEVLGAAIHDAYHAGQVMLVRRMLGQRARMV
jgi:hypothetical protein